MMAGMHTTRTFLLAGALAVALLAGCQPTAPPPVADPPAVTGSPSVAVFGDSLTPVADYQHQARVDGWRLTSWAQGGSHICTPAPDGRPMWQTIDQAIGSFDAVVLQYQGWQNFTLDCGHPADGLPGGTRAVDPGRRWRVLLDHFLQVAAAHGTGLFLAESPGAPSDRRSWVIPQRIMDQAARTIAARHPGTVTFMPSRAMFTTPDGAWTATSGCLAQETTAGMCDHGLVTLRGPDRIHYACPGTAGLTCAGRTPAGLRHALITFRYLGDALSGPTRPRAPMPAPPG